jgi:rRNA maturation endonuclease Nob1
MLGTPLDVSLDHDFHIDIEHALLCVDCSHVYQMPRSTCPSCTSRSALPLARVLSVRPKPASVKS